MLCDTEILGGQQTVGCAQYNTNLSSMPNYPEVRKSDKRATDLLFFLISATLSGQRVELDVENWRGDEVQSGLQALVEGLNLDESKEGLADRIANRLRERLKEKAYQ